MRRFLALATSSFLLMPSLALAIAAPLSVTVGGQVMVFNDVPSDAWYAADLETAVTAGVVSGYKNAQGQLTGMYGPADNVTYAQAIKIAVEAAGYPVEEYPKSEMYPDHWASVYMEVGTEMHFVSTEGDAQQIDRPATRAEVALIMADAFQVAKGSMEDEHYTDVSDDTAHAQAIAALTRDGVVTGDKKASGELAYTYRPGAPVNRAETVKMAMSAWAEYGDVGAMSHPSEMHSSMMMEDSHSSSSGTMDHSSSAGMMDSHSSSAGMTMSSSSSAAMQAEPHVVTYTDAGFSPSSVTIKSGESITFRNESNAAMWVKSDVQQDSGGFDAGVSVNKGGMYTFKFTNSGTWSFYNSVTPANKGSVTVQQQ